MCDTGYSLNRLLGDLRQLQARSLDDDAMAAAAEQYVRRLMKMKHNWLRGYMCAIDPVEGTGLYKLHEEPDHRLAIFVVTRPPGEGTAPHDHGTWAVIAGLEGREVQQAWRRLDDASHPGVARIERAEREALEPGSTLSMPPRAIHSLHNESDEKSVTLHVYGVSLELTERFDFDPASNAVARHPGGGAIPQTATSQEAT